LGAKLDQSLNSTEVIQAVSDSLTGAPGMQSEVSLAYPIARNFDLSVWRLPNLESQGPAWAMVALHDVTASKKADQMRADFVANVSHELRSPLSSLLGFIETLRDTARDDPAATDRFLGIMESEALRMTRLINDLLALSKVEIEEHIRPEKSMDLHPVLNQVAETMGVRAKERGMDIALELPGNLPLIAGNPDELTQVFQNLIANAINYGRAETTIRIVVADRTCIPESENPAVSVSVINLGEGIPAEDIPRLTERFYRVDKGRSRSMGGTGLGLAIVKHIVARHRGLLDIESRLGHDASFTVYLPLAET
jgi:two-component system phosphate regulon sensor histidine kinase PhoR